MAPSIRSVTKSRGPPPTRAPEPTSPTLTATTSASHLDLGAEGPRIIITRADLRSSVTALAELLKAAKAYRLSLATMSAATTAFAGALGECARVKGAGETGEQLLAASGIQYMVGSQGQVLSDTLYRSFEIPLLHAYDSYVASIAARHAEYEALLAEKTAAIRATEAENLRQGRKKSRDLSQFRRALERLQEQVREVEVCKGSYYSEVLDGEIDTWGMVGEKVSILLRSTLDLSDRLASKATSDPTLESMLAEVPDPFDVYRMEDQPERDVFSILPPLGMNLGLGASKRGSVIDNDRDREAELKRDRDAGIVSPKQGPTSLKGNGGHPKKATPYSVADVLGLNSSNDDSPPSSFVPNPSSSHLPPLPPVLEPPSVSPTTASPSSTKTSDPSSHDETYSDPPPTEFDSLTEQDPPSPSRHSISSSTSASSTTLTSGVPPPSLEFLSAPSTERLERKSNSSSNARRLSRVSEREQENDPMIGDWDSPVFGKELSPPILSGDSEEWETSRDEEGKY